MMQDEYGFFCWVSLMLTGTGLLMFFYPYTGVWQARLMKILGCLVVLAGIRLFPLMAVLIISLIPFMVVLAILALEKN